MFIPWWVFNASGLILIGYALGRGKETGWGHKGVVELLCGIALLGISIMLMPNWN